MTASKKDDHERPFSEANPEDKMKHMVEALSEEQLRQTHPLADIAPGWFFRVAETSSFAWMAEGKDKWGRLVSCRGSDEKEALRLCAEQAAIINARLSRP